MLYACTAENSSEISVQDEDFKEAGEEETLKKATDFVTTDAEQSGDSTDSASGESTESSSVETSTGFPGLTLPSFELDEIEVVNIDGDLDSSPIGLDAILNINFQETISFQLFSIKVTQPARDSFSCSFEQKASNTKTIKGISLENCMEELNDGPISVSVKLKDNDIIVSEGTVSMVLDRKGPVAGDDITHVTDEESIALSFEMEDGDTGSGVKGYFCQLDNEQEVECQSPYTVSGDAGTTRKLRVKSIDNVKNLSSVQTFTVIFEEKVQAFHFEAENKTRLILNRCGGPYTVSPLGVGENKVILANDQKLKMKTDLDLEAFVDPECLIPLSEFILKKGEQDITFYMKGEIDEAGWVSFEHKTLGVSNKRFMEVVHLRLGAQFHPGSDLYRPTRIHWDGTNFFASGDATSRVLMFKGIPGPDNQMAKIAIGQASVNEVTINVEPNEFNLGAAGVSGMWSNGKMLIISDSPNNRVLIWKNMPKTGDTPADIVLGQDTFSSNVLSCGQNRTPSPFGVASDGTRIAVADRLGNRVMLWNSIPTANGQPADLVLGQENFGNCAVNRLGVYAADANTMFNPFGVALDNGRIVVADTWNHRVLIWNSWPTTNGQAADLVLGHANMTSYGPNRHTSPDRASAPNPDATTLSQPMAVHAANGQIGVADYYNGRFLFWRTWPTTNGQAADLVLGHTSFNTTTGQNSYSTTPELATQSPYGVTFDENMVALSEYDGRSILIYNKGLNELTNGQVPDYVQGQGNLTSNQPWANSPQPLSTARSISSDGTMFCSTAIWKDAVYIWKKAPTDARTPPDLVLGTTDPANTKYSGSPLNFNLNTPNGIACEDGRIAVADTGNHRVLVWNSIPENHGAPADLVLGQDDFTSNQKNKTNTNTPSSSSLNAPWGVEFDGDKILVADSGSTRVLIWNSTPEINGAPADIVLGKNDFTSTGGSASRSIIKHVKSVSARNGKIVVGGAERVLIWNSYPTTNGSNADIVLGQDDWTTTLGHDYYFSTTDRVNGIKVTDSNLTHIRGVWTDGVKIAVTSHFGHRAMIWDTWPTVNNAPATIIYGQPDSVTIHQLNNAVRTQKLRLPMGITYANDHFYISDWQNSILVVPHSGKK